MWLFFPCTLQAVPASANASRCRYLHFAAVIMAPFLEVVAPLIAPKPFSLYILSADFSCLARLPPAGFFQLAASRRTVFPFAFPIIVSSCNIFTIRIAIVLVLASVLIRSLFHALSLSLTAIGCINPKHYQRPCQCQKIDACVLLHFPLKKTRWNLLRRGKKNKTKQSLRA